MVCDVVVKDVPADQAVVVDDLQVTGSLRAHSSETVTKIKNKIVAGIMLVSEIEAGRAYNDIHATGGGGLTSSSFEIQQFSQFSHFSLIFSNSSVSLSHAWVSVETSSTKILLSFWLV